MIINPIDDKLDIIIMAGQSNAQGCGIGPTTMLWSVDADILMLKGVYEKKNEDADISHIAQNLVYTDTSKIVFADERHAEGYRRGVLGLSFAKKYKEEFLEKDRKILIVEVARGGTSFAEKYWTKDGGLYNQMLIMVNDALKLNVENRVVGFLWHQGESDSARNPNLNDSELFEFYKSCVGLMIEDVREKFGDMPFISGGFNNEFNKKNIRAEIIENALKTVANEVDACAFVEGKDLQSNNQVLSNNDPFHFSRESIYILGNRYFEAYKKIVKGE